MINALTEAFKTEPSYKLQSLRNSVGKMIIRNIKRGGSFDTKKHKSAWNLSLKWVFHLVLSATKVLWDPSKSLLRTFLKGFFYLKTLQALILILIF